MAPVTHFVWDGGRRLSLIPQTGRTSVRLALSRFGKALTPVFILIPGTSTRRARLNFSTKHDIYA